MSYKRYGNINPLVCEQYTIVEVIITIITIMKLAQTEDKKDIPLICNIHLLQIDDCIFFQFFNF